MLDKKTKNRFSKFLFTASTVLCFSLLASKSVKASSDVAITEVNFPDEAMRTCVSSFDSDKDGMLSDKERAAVTYIDIKNPETKDITGIKYFYNLEHFYCPESAITNVDFSNMQHLNYIYIAKSKVETLNVSKMPSLTDVKCMYSNLKNFNFADSYKIEKLGLNGNSLPKVDVSKLPELKELYVGDNKLKTLDVSHNKKLEHLYCGWNELTTLDLSNQPGMKYINCKHDQLTTLKLANKTALTELQCSDNMLTTLDLTNDGALRTLNCSNNQLTTLNLKNQSGLLNLDCSINKLKTLDLSNLTEVSKLNVGINELDKLEVNHMKDLSELDIYGNNYTSLDIHGLKNLRFIWLCSTRYLTNIKLYDLPRLENLWLYDNRSLEEVDLSNLPSLKQVALHYNKLKLVKFCNPNNIERLDIGSNYLTSLDLSGFHKLSELNCSCNKLTTFKFDENSILKKISAYGNFLLSLKIPNVEVNGQEMIRTVESQNPMIIIPKENRIDLSEYPDIDVSKISNLVGATLDGSTLIVASDLKDNLITYDYAVNDKYVLKSKIQTKHGVDISDVYIDIYYDQKYTGKPITIDPYDTRIALDDRPELIYGVDYIFKYKNNINPGTATLIVEGIGEYYGSASKEFKILPADKPMVTPPQKPTVTPTKPTSAPAKPAPKVVKKAISKVKVSSISNKTYTGKAIKPSFTIKYGNTKLKYKKDYTLSYKNNTKTGKATIVIKGIGNYTGTKTITFKIVPKKVTSFKATSKKRKTVAVSWKKATGASGYQVVYSTKKNSGYKTAKITSKSSYTISKLKSRRTYYVKVRAYKVISGKKVYGAYCTPKKVKIR